MDYRRLAVKQQARLPSRETPEGKYWKKFKSPILIKEYGAVSSVYFSPVAPYDFAIASSTRVQIYSSKTHQPKKTISRFKDIAYSASFRQDGKLVVAGDETGLVQVFDVNSRAILRTFREHTLPVRVTKFSSENTQIMTASDDRTVRLWDIPAEKSIHVFEDHQDYVRAGVVSQDNPHMLVTGSYDQTIKIWDTRQNGCVMTMQHDAPVESVLMYPGGGAVVSAGGPGIKVWDLLSGGRCMHAVSNQQKTVTSLCFDSTASRLVTGSLDQHVKVYNVQDYKVAYSFKYPAPILSVALSPDDTHLVAGMTNSLLSIRKRQVKSEERTAQQKKQQYIRGGTYKYFMRGANAGLPAEDDFAVEHTRRRRLASYDKLLKKNKFSDALDEAIGTSRRTVSIGMALLQELIHVGGLEAALQGRDDVTLEPILRFLVKHIQDPRFTALVVDVSEVLLDLYTPSFGQSPLIDDLLKDLKRKVRKEIELQRQLAQTTAALEMLFAKSGAGSDAVRAAAQPIASMSHLSATQA
ncbi:WD40-repeat-containing domain protein [Syncephalastrum racemosum]|uniref:WD40-repeat-containing domain protein n=1 Tax=Syncephalastrum racemosum TaxID=13706 RepID=A0A1X2H797_SYNRA|nr:WD40-repeat-containing domain protein [Syncephalastrum racemosum]